LEGLPAPLPAPSEQPISAVGDGTLTMFGMDVLAYPQIVRIVFRFPYFSCIREWWGNVRSAN